MDGKSRFKLIKSARLIDGNGGPPMARGAVLLENDKIREIGTTESIMAPEGALVEEFDYGEKTVLPGLVDCHVHLIGIGDGRTGDDLTTLSDEVLTLQAARGARAHLYNGVTTVQDCGGKNQTTFMLRKAVDMGITPAPRLVLSGPPMAIIGGHLNYWGIGATGPDECRAAVRQLIKDGADYIKITATGGSTATSFPYRLRPSFTVEELRAICDEAHKFGKHTAAHCSNIQGTINSLDGGVDTIIHGDFNEPDGTHNYRPDIAERIAKQGAMFNATLHCAGQKMIWRLRAKQESDGLTQNEQAILDRSRRSYETRLDAFAKLRTSGVIMVAGSDQAWGIDPMGEFQYELESHVEGGMTPMEAIVAGTRDSARACWIDDKIGTIEQGKLADLLVVDGDPSKDIKALWNLEAVFLNGDLVDRENLV